MLNALTDFAKECNAANLVWAVGGSLLLAQYGLVSRPNDIDILTDPESFAQAASIMKSIGEEQPRTDTPTFSTLHYRKYIVSNVMVDLMSGLAINHPYGQFRFFFDSASISGTMKTDGMEIPLASLEDWYVIYSLIPGRQAKADLIRTHLMTNGVRRANLLSRILEAQLPPELKENIKQLLAMP